MVYDCRPPLLPVSLDLSGIGPLSGLHTVVSTSAVVPPRENGLTISGGGGRDSGLAWISYSGAWGCSTRGLGDRPSRGVDLEMVRVLLEVGV